MPNKIKPENIIDRLILFCLQNKLVVVLITLMIIGWGVLVAPFDWQIPGVQRNPVPVDAIPDLGENQQIVFTEWSGHSPQDIEDQITYPMTTALLGIPGVKTVRSFSMFGFSSVYVIFKEDVDFYWSRSRILEKLNSLPPNLLPEGVQPTLGPDATALGQVFWYTLEGRDPQGNPTGGWDLHELRSAQDWYVRYSLLSAEGVSEVASVGGFVQEYQVDVDPDAMRAYDVSLAEVFAAVKMSNLDVGARTIEMNQVEYVIRGVGFVKKIEDIENSVIKTRDNVPVYIRNVANVAMGPALRRGALDKGGAEAVGGVVVVRYGDNPLQAIKNVKAKIAEIAPGLPKKILPDGTVSQLTVVPFYDRTGLIYETLDTLNSALVQQILVTAIVVILMVMHLRSSLLIASLLPLAVLMTFIAMKYAGVDANIVALSGIAIAIGTMVDMGIVITENILKHLDAAKPEESRLAVIYRASSEVGSAVITAVATTVVSFLPVFTMEAAEGKLFKPLAYTKTFALIASVFVALTLIPPFAQLLFTGKIRRKNLKIALSYLTVLAGLAIAFWLNVWLGIALIIFGLYQIFQSRLPQSITKNSERYANYIAIAAVTFILTDIWMPLGVDRAFLVNLLLILLMGASVLLVMYAVQRNYERLLNTMLDHRRKFLSFIFAIIFSGGLIWLGFDFFFGWLPNAVRSSRPVSAIAHTFPGLGKEFMPALDEGSYLYMPTTMPHASIGEALDVLQKQDMAFTALPEIESTVGKIGRAETPLDPAPVSMIETVINYHPQFLLDENSRLRTFRFDADSLDVFRAENGEPVPAPDGEPYVVRGAFLRDANGNLIAESGGQPFRVWRPALDPALNDGRKAWAGIQNPDDIWDEIVASGQIPGSTSAPKLQPIAARIVMLQSGMRAPMGIKIKGPDLQSIEAVGLQMEQLLKQLPSIEPATVLADRIIGKPYLEIEIDREAISRYGIRLQTVQEVIMVAVGGMPITMTVEGRERYPIRVRYLRELRGNVDDLERILVPAPDGAQIPLAQLAQIHYIQGPQMIKSEDTFLTGYVVFDKKAGLAEVDVVQQAQQFLQKKTAAGELTIPAGVSYSFAGTYENQVRSEARLRIILPLALAIIFLILYFQFRSVPVTALVFSGIIVAWSGGFILLWLYGQSWFLNFSLFGADLRNLFQIEPINLSVAVWVGFLALFGIASDDGVLITTYLTQIFRRDNPQSIADIRAATVEAGKKRIRPALMTSATTILALLPVLTSTGRGSDIMVPMAIPTFGGMLIAIITLFVVPVLYFSLAERGWLKFGDEEI